MNEQPASDRRGETSTRPAQSKLAENAKSDDESLAERLKVQVEKLQQEVDKVKAENDKPPEKLKGEAEAIPKFYKEGDVKVPEKGLTDKPPEKLKSEAEVTPYKFYKEGDVKVPEKGLNEITEKFQAEILQSRAGAPAGPSIDRETLLRHAAALERMGRELRHFIEQDDRPDLSRGALQDEPDQQDQAGDA